MKTVLLLDDARAIRNIYSEVIRQAGFQAYTAADAEEGLLHIAEHGLPDLIVTDINMPGIGGLEFCKRVRDISKQVPMFVMSVYSERALVMEAQFLGITGWMLKPVEPEYFLNALRAVFDDPQTLST